GVLKGILFHQGESNSGSSNQASWMAGVTDLARNLRNTFNVPNVPFLIGELGYYRTTSSNINSILPELISEIPRSDLVSANGLNDFDGTHFDSYSANILGKRYAAKMLEITDSPKISAFTEGNLAVIRAGDGSRANNTGAQKIFV